MRATGGWPDSVSTTQASSLCKALALSKSGSKPKTLMLGHVAPGIWVAGGTGGNKGGRLVRAFKGLLGGLRGEMLSVIVHCMSLCLHLCVYISVYICLSLCVSVSLSLCVSVIVSVSQSVFLCLSLVSLSLPGQNYHVCSLSLAPVGRKHLSGRGLERGGQAHPDLAWLLPGPALAPLGQWEEACSPGRPGSGGLAFPGVGLLAPRPSELAGFFFEPLG